MPRPILRQPILATGLLIASLLAVACAGGGRSAQESAPSTDTSDAPTTTAPLAEQPPATAVRSTVGESGGRRITVDGVDRTYRVHVPEGVAGPVPLVVALHGGGGSAEQFSTSNQFEALADEEGFVVAHLDGLAGDRVRLRTWNGGYCCNPAVREGHDDGSYIRAAIDEVSASQPIDPDRIYLVGHSNGAIMSYRFACEQADIVAAIAVVAGSMGGVDCQPDRPVSILHIHGSADRNHPYDGGRGEGISSVTFNGVDDTVAAWVGLNGCADGPETRPGPPDVTVTTWSGCADDVTVELQVIEGAEHPWPGGSTLIPGLAGTPSQAMDATAVAWEFLAAHGR